MAIKVVVLRCLALASVVTLVSFWHHMASFATLALTLMDRETKSAKIVKKIAFYKSHKTASSSFGAFVFRLAHHQNMSIYAPPIHYIHDVPSLSAGEFDAVLNHIAFPSGVADMSYLKKLYDHLLGPRYIFVSTVRDALSRYLSFFYYVVLPNEPNTTLQEYVRSGRGANALAAEFGLFSEQEVLNFFKNRTFPFTFLVPAEFLDLGMSYLHHELQVSAGSEYLAYLPVNVNDGETLRYDGKKMHRPCRPGTELQTQIQSLISLDKFFYEAAVSDFFSKIAASKFHGDVLATAHKLALLSNKLATVCLNDTDCSWFALTDLQYENISSFTSKPNVAQKAASLRNKGYEVLHRLGANLV